jgi:hypothetical protein
VRRPSGGTGLLGVALLGVVAALLAPRRYGRRGGLGVLGGVSVLLARDASMVLTGTQARLKVVPRVLLYLELVSAATATGLGLASWLRHDGYVRVASGRSHPAAKSTVDVAASSIAALTFLLHTFRQAIYLTPGQGRREAAAKPDRGANGVGIDDEE